MPKRLTNAQVIACGFFLLILTGTLLLCLPAATRDGQSASFSDALFTAASASCVTGLVVRDTALYWSSFGQAVILLLIQIGGMGFMTISTFLLLLFRRHIGIRNRERMIESINTADSGSILPLTRKIFAGTAAIELLGAALLAIRFIPRLGVRRGIWFSVFHAVSAFCNAGFDLMGPVSGPYTSFTALAGDWLVVPVLCALITLGGLGYWVWDDLWHNRLHWRRYRLHTKVVLTVSAILTVGGAVLFWLAERRALAAFPAGEQVLRVVFDAVTPRTAGFATTDTATLTAGGKLLTIVYMFIGGSPGSTAGGVKTTSVAVLVLYTLSEMRHQRDCGAFGRRIDPVYHRRAAAVVANNLGLALVAAWLLCLRYPAIPLPDVLVETFSAIGTVGMTTGVTQHVFGLGRVVLIFLMYCGRVGSLSFSIALLEKRSRPPVRPPAEPLIIG